MSANAECRSNQPSSQPYTAISVRVSLPEKARIMAMAEQRGVTVSELLRTTVQCHPQQRNLRRVPTLEDKQLALLIAQISALGRELKRIQAADRQAISPLLSEVRHVLAVLIEVVL